MPYNIILISQNKLSAKFPAGDKELTKRSDSAENLLYSSREPLCWTIRMKALRIFLLLILALAGSGCAMLADRDAQSAYWQDLDEPGQVMAAYVSALADGDLARAAAYLYLPVGVKDDTVLREQLGRISAALRGTGNSIRVADCRSETRIALVIYTTNAIGGDPNPVFLIRDTRNRWQLHHKATAGPLQKALRDRSDVLEVRALANWGAQRMAEINKLARERMLANR
jgi:hypothetical protein